MKATERDLGQVEINTDRSRSAPSLMLRLGSYGAVGLTLLAWACGGSSGGPEKTPNTKPEATKRADVNQQGLGTAELCVGIPSGFDVTLTVPTIVTPEASPTPEVVSSNEGILDLGDWQLATVGWEELDSIEENQGLIGFANPADKEKLKFVAVRTVLRNKSDHILDTSAFTEIFGDFQFRLTDKNGMIMTSGQPFPAPFYGDGINLEPYFIGADGKPSYLEAANKGPFKVAPGFGIPIGLLFMVPKVVNDYGLAIEPIKQGLANPNHVQIRTSEYESATSADPSTIIRRGEVANDVSTVAPDVKISPFTIPLVYRHKSSFQANWPDQPPETFELLPIGLSQPEPEADGSMRQKLRFTVTNVSEVPIYNGAASYLRDVSIGGSASSKINVMLYLKDGRVIAPVEGADINEFLDINMQQVLQVAMTSSRPVLGPTGGWDEPALYKLLSPEDIDQAIVVMVSTVEPDWAAWELITPDTR